MKNVQAIIKSRRIELGLTMKELADKVGVNVGTISRWESGEVANMTRKNMVLLAKALNISPLELLDENPNNGYYTDPETAELAEKLRTDPDIKILFSAAKDLTPEEMQQAADYVNYLKIKGRNK